MSDATSSGGCVDAFADVRSSVVEHPDLFARVTRTIEEAELRRRFRLRLAAGDRRLRPRQRRLALVLSDRQRREDHHAVVGHRADHQHRARRHRHRAGPFIKRFGRAYAADVFRANPRTGKSYLVLTDVAYYLIFTAFILFTVTFVEPPTGGRPATSSSTRSPASAGSC